MFLPMENQEPGECLRGDFHSPAQRALRGAVRHENNVFRFEQGVWGFPRQDPSQVDRSLLSFTTLLICADDSRFAAVRVRPSLKASACRTEIFSFDFRANPPGLRTSPIT